MTISPGAVIGILGGGQLGRMLALAAAELGFDVHVFTDEADSPASRVSARTSVARFDDEAALRAFASDVAVVTSEFENVPAATARILTEAGAIVRPNPRALEIAQDRIAEKAFFNDAGIATTPFRAIDSEADLVPALQALGAPALLKTRRLGYDGKGQCWIKSPNEVPAAWRAVNTQPAILEAAAPFAFEVSLIGARGLNGDIRVFDLCENRHADGILAETRVPARDADALTPKAEAAMRQVLEALDYVGVLTIEFFVMPDGQLLANEMAPRVHNSGHWTRDACRTSQFEQQIRAVAGWPLANPRRFADVEMLNLIGHAATDWRRIAAEPTVGLHLYGKRDARPGRKMGHYTRVTAREQR
jgi:5-(carboxyamino)imidazole ribonucleotide synthase